MMRQNAATIGWFVILSIVPAVAHGVQAQAPVIASFSPCAIAPGRVSEILIRGSNLKEIRSVWTSFPCEAELLPEPKSDDSRTCRFTLPSGTSLGIGAIRFYGLRGVSNIHLLMIDDLATIAESGKNKSIESPDPLTLPVAVEGFCEPVGSRFYKINGKKGQRLSVDVVAQRLGSRLDPLVRLLDANGHELVWCDDDPAAAGADSRFTHLLPSDGNYILEIRDTNYDGGREYRYRLRVGEFELSNFHILANPSRPIETEIKESEPNDSPQSATPITLPSVIIGRFDSPNDHDIYRFTAEKGDRLSFIAYSRSLGLPCDVLMRVTRLDGSRLPEEKSLEIGESNLDVNIPEAGQYFLHVDELNKRGGGALGYRIESKRDRPGFAISLEGETFEISPGGGAQIKVTCERSDYKGPIQLESAGDSVLLENNLIAADKKENLMKLIVPASAKAGTILHFSIIGRATTGPKTSLVTASTLPALKKSFPSMLCPPGELNGIVTVGVIEKNN